MAKRNQQSVKFTSEKSANNFAEKLPKELNAKVIPAKSEKTDYNYKVVHKIDREYKSSKNHDSHKTRVDCENTHGAFVNPNSHLDGW